MTTMKNKDCIRTILYYFFAILILLYTILPILWIVFTSFKTESEIFSAHQKILPDSFLYIDNYKAILNKTAYGRYFINSMIITLFSTALVMICAIFSGYSFSSTFNFKGKNACMIFIIVARMIPEIAIIIPMYFFLQKIGLYDTKLGIGLVISAMAYPLAAWLLKTFFDDIPMSLFDAAKIDGCNSLQTLRKIVLPISGPSISSTLIITFLTIWNSFLIPLSLSKTVQAKTFSIAISELAYSEFGVSWGNISALSVIAVIPMFLIGIFAQKYIIAGLTSGSEKG